MRFLIASKSDPLIQQQLMPNRVAQRVILPSDDYCPLMPLTTVLLVLDLSI